MRRDEVIDRWAKILYDWSIQCGVDMGLTTTEKALAWEDFQNKFLYTEVAEKLWEEIG